jgi:hypothetical protein
LLRNRQAPCNGLEALEGRTLLSTDLALSVGTLKQGVDHYNNPTISVPVTVVNNGSTPLPGGGSIDYYLSTDRTLDESDFRFASTALPIVRGPGSTGKITLNTLKPGLLAPSVGRPVPVGDYFIIAKLVTKIPGADIDPSNDQAATIAKVSITYQFGQVGEASNVPLRVTLPSGNDVTFVLQGRGTGQVVNVDGRIIVIVDGSTTQTGLRIIPAKPNQSTVINDVTINGAPAANGNRGIVPAGLKDFYAAGVTIDGNLTISGAVGLVNIGSLRHSNFTVTGVGAYVEITMGDVVDSSITTSVPIQSLTVKSWRNTDGTPDLVSAAWIDSITSRGDFEPDVHISTNHKTLSMTRALVGGHISGTWLINGNVNQINAGSLAASWAATILGTVNILSTRGNAGGTLGAANIRRMSIGGNLTGATYLAGANLGNNGLVDGQSNGDTFAAGRIGLIEVLGQMVNSHVGAGFSTDDNIIGNADDRVLSGGSIETIIINGGMTNSIFYAAQFPTKAKIHFKQITTAGNGNFVTS